MNLEVDVLQDIISLSELKDNPNAVIDDVQTRRVTKIVTRRGKPSAVIVNLEDYIRLKEALAEAEAREIRQLHQDFLQAESRGEIGTSDELWQHFGLKPPLAGSRKRGEAAS